MNIRCLNTLYIFKEDLKESKVMQKRSYWIEVKPTFVISFIVIDKKVTREQFRASDIYKKVMEIKKLHKSKLIYENKTRKSESSPKASNR